MATAIWKPLLYTDVRTSSETIHHHIFRSENVGKDPKEGSVPAKQKVKVHR